MNKKEMKFYTAPTCEVVELKVSAALLAGSPKTDPFDGNTQDPGEEE